MSDFNVLTLQPILAVLTKLQIQLQLDSKEKRALDYALWDIVYHYHSCSGLSARLLIQIILNATYFIPGSHLDNKNKRDILAYALTPDQTEHKGSLLHYKVKFNNNIERRLRRVIIPRTTANVTQTELKQPNASRGEVDLKWVLKDV